MIAFTAATKPTGKNFSLAKANALADDANPLPGA